MVYSGINTPPLGTPPFKQIYFAPFCFLTLRLPDKLQPYGLYVYYVVHICNFGMLRVKDEFKKISGVMFYNMLTCVYVLQACSYNQFWQAFLPHEILMLNILEPWLDDFFKHESSRVALNALKAWFRYFMLAYKV